VKTVDVFRLDSPDEGILAQVQELFTSMYEYMESHGLQVPLAAGGAATWREGVARSLGRLSTLAVAREGHAVVGFAHGAISLLPPYLGGLAVGKVHHVFVDEAHRAGGTGQRLVFELDRWFAERGASSVELQVLCENESAIRFWKGRGFRSELLQMRRPPLSPGSTDGI
jgi:GNAT superfamily N-acetyltransferase